MKPNPYHIEGEPRWMRWAHKDRKRRCSALKCRMRQGCTILIIEGAHVRLCADHAKTITALAECKPRRDSRTAGEERSDGTPET